MIEQEVNRASTALQEEKEHLIAFLKERMSTIVFPEDQTLAEAKQGSATIMNEKLPIYLLGGGALGLIVGLCAKITAIWVFGGVAGAIGAYLLLSKKNDVGEVNSRKQDGQVFDFSKISNTIYKSLEGAHSHIAKEWDSYLVQQNAYLSSVIRSSDLSEEEKIRMIDKVTKRSIIEFSMMDAFTELNSVSKTKNVSAIKRTLDLIVEKYIIEIGRACDKQLSVYASLTNDPNV